MIIGLKPHVGQLFIYKCLLFLFYNLEIQRVGKIFGGLYKIPQNMLGALRIMPWYPYSLGIVCTEKPR